MYLLYLRISYCGIQSNLNTSKTLSGMSFHKVTISTNFNKRSILCEDIPKQYQRPFSHLYTLINSNSKTGM